MIFVSVGTTHGFDRLVRAVDEAVNCGLITEAVYAQVGNGSYRPRHLCCVPSMHRAEFDECIGSASSVISHAGMGILTSAVERGKPALVMPRRRRFGEAVNDHQVAIAEEFSRRGHVLLARDKEELFEKVGELGAFVPVPRQTGVDMVVGRIVRFLDSVSPRTRRRG